MPPFQPGLMSTLNVSCKKAAKVSFRLPISIAREFKPYHAGAQLLICVQAEGGQLGGHAVHTCTLWLFPLPSITERLIFSRFVVPCSIRQLFNLYMR